MKKAGAQILDTLKHCNFSSDFSYLAIFAIMAKVYYEFRSRGAINLGEFFFSRYFRILKLKLFSRELYRGTNLVEVVFFQNLEIIF